MVKHRLRKGLTEPDGIDPKTDEIVEQQKMTKAELEQKTTRILKLIQNKDQGKSKGMARDSNKETEVVGLVEDLYNNYQSIYKQYGHLRDEAERIASSSKGKEKNKEDISSSSSSSSSDSDSEYFSSEEIDTSTDLQNELSRNLPVQIQADELEKQIFQKNEALAKVDSLRWELDSVRKQKRESENRKNQEISEHMNLIANLKEQLTERIEVEKRILEDKEKVLARIKDLETELNTIHNMRGEIEEHNIRIRSENQRLNTRNSELELALTEQKTNAAPQTDGIKLGQEIPHRFSEIEAENNKLKSKITDLERIITENDEIITKFKSKTYIPDAASTKMEELAEELRISMEDKIRTLSHRILVAEQLHKESRSNFRARKKRYEQEKRQLEQKIENHESELMKLSNTNEFGMDAMARKFEEESGKLLNHILWIAKELTIAKYWVKTRNNEMKNLEMNVARFVAQMEEKEEQEFMLREKVWNLEAKISKEGGEKLNLIRSLGRLEKKMTKMEIIVKEKDEEVFRVAEEKREVIRQLCVVIDHHRRRYDLLKAAMLGKNVRNTLMI